MTSPIALYTKIWMSGGTGLFAQELAAGIVEAHGEVIFIAPEAEQSRFEMPRPGLTRFRPRRELKSGPRAKRILVSLARIGGSMLGLARARLRTRIFVVSIPDPFVFALPMFFLLRLSGARIVYIEHDPIPHAWHLPPRLRFIERAVFRATYALSSSIVVLSEASRQTLLDAYRLDTRRVTVIEHGVFPLGDPTDAPGNGQLLLFGTLRRNKGIREAIAGVAAARANGAKVHLTIAGAPSPLEPDYWADCNALARAHADAVTLEIGYVDDRRLQDLIRSSDAFLLPYRAFNSQSGVAVLASSNRRIVIGSRAGGIGDLIADGMAAIPIEEPVDEDAVAQAVAAFARIPIGEWNARAEAYRNHALATRGWPAIGAHYVRLAESLR